MRVTASCIHHRRIRQLPRELPQIDFRPDDLRLGFIGDANLNAVFTVMQRACGNLEVAQILYMSRHRKFVCRHRGSGVARYQRSFKDSTDASAHYDFRQFGFVAGSAIDPQLQRWVAILLTKGEKQFRVMPVGTAADIDSQLLEIPIVNVQRKNWPDIQ